MKEKLLFFLFVSFFLSFPISISYSNAIGIGPDNIEIEFKPNLTYKTTFYIVNSEKYLFPVEMYAEGELAKYISFSEKYFTLSPSGTNGFIHFVNVTLKLPESLGNPGAHKAIIYASQRKDKNVGGISAIVRVGKHITVYVPYPGKYVEIKKIDIENPEVNKTIKFKIEAVNRGNTTIDIAYCRLKIVNPKGLEIATIESSPRKMEPSVYVTFKGEWTAKNVKPGKYKLIVEISYEDFKKIKSKEFMIGSPTIDILGITTEPIYENSIGKIRAKIKSNWNEKIDDVVLTVHLKKRAYSTQIKAPSFSINPWEEKYVDVYWDTSTNSKGPGKYTGLAVLSYLNRTSEKLFVVRVKNWFEFSPEQVLIMLLIILVIALILVFYKKRKQK